MLSDTRSILRTSRAGTIVSVPRGAWSISTTSKNRERTGIVQRLKARSKVKKNAAQKRKVSEDGRVSTSGKSKDDAMGRESVLLPGIPVSVETIVDGHP